MRPIRTVSVLMPTWQGIEFLERALRALAGQTCTLPWDFLAIDSGSTDGTWELLGRVQADFPVPFQRLQIDGLEFDHGDTRNELAARSQGDLLVYLTQDAIPSSSDWLERLVANFEVERVAAAYCRNVPRPDAHLLTRIFSNQDPGYAPGRREQRIHDLAAYALMSAHEKRVLWNFNDVASALRRELWERCPFARTWFGEDVLLARALLEAGHTVVYDDEATVEHSHDYSPEQSAERARIDGRFNAEWLDRVCVASKADARVLAERQLARDRETLQAAGLSDAEYGQQLELAARLRGATFEGLYEGGLAQARHAPARVLERSQLSILYVVHGFPPEAWAGTEIYTLNLALEMQRRGHRVSVLARTDRGEGPDGTLREEEFRGLRVLRMLRREPHRRIADSYRDERIEAAFGALLLREKPDLVHFQHLIHLSAGLVHVARELDLPTVLHCHDFWALCARVQMIRPDGVRCEDGMDAGCFLCVKERGLRSIPRLKRMAQVTSRVWEALEKGTRKGRILPPELRARWEGFGDMVERRPYVVGCYAAAQLRVSPSRFLRAMLVEQGGLDAHTTIFSDNGLSTGHLAALEKRPDPKGRVRFGFVGSLVWYKGDQTLVRAMRELDPERAVLHVWGDFKPGEDAHHAELARLAGPNVEFKGRFDNARLAEVYAELDVLVVPSLWWENSPITIHEAHLLRTPVVTSGIGGMAEFVRDGIDGLHFRVGDVGDLAAKLRRFVDEPELAAELSRDFPPLKTLEEDGRTTEYRYRALCARQASFGPRPLRPRTLWERAGIASARREGACEQQGAQMLLLRPGSAAEYDLSGAAGGARTLRVEQFALAAEPSLALGLRVLVDGVELGRIPARRAGASDETFGAELELELAALARVLRLEPLEGCHGRISRLVLATRARVGEGLPA
ncbi:MAG: glycosyltransferase [Planctomycetes bacterium]|nr:glycosyltransferase [Planctomycetota bacterium]